MAGPVTHIVLALAVLQSGLCFKDKKAFIVGTSFPDIRYLGVIERTKTHKNSVTWQDVLLEPCAFKAGMYFHALVDKLREEYLEASGIYTLLPKSRYLSYAMKQYEDEIFMRYISPLEPIEDYFDDILQDEMYAGVQESYVLLWHTILKTYIKYVDDVDKVLAMYERIGLPASAITELHALIDEIKKNPQLREVIEQFYIDFPRLLDKDCYVR